MLFNSLDFIYVFLPLAVILHFLAARWSVTAAIATTTLSSLAFYAWWKLPFVVLPLISVVGNFWLAREILRSDKKTGHRIMLVGVAINLLVLGYFKYFDFLVSILERRSPVLPDVPLALSFTTFVQVAFLVEFERDRSPIVFRPYAMFVTFFPHLIAGPIVRWTELGPQLADKARYRVNWHNVALGLTIFCIGLAKKVLYADRLAPHVAGVFDAATAGMPITAAAAWGASVAYSVQLYFDFSGYSDMAVGLGLLFNIRLPINFAAPFRATSMIDLWRRWHISLSRFLRDFVYIPLGGSEGGPVRRSINLVATMVLGGLWHGANWTFIAWGAFHGVLLVVNHLWRQLCGTAKKSLIGSLLGWALTFGAFAVGMTMFRSPDIQTAGRLLKAMAGFGHAQPGSPLMVESDFWAIDHEYVSEAFLRTWLGSYWSLVGTLLTTVLLAVALFLPDTMEVVDYREGEPRSNWRQQRRFLVWRPTASWAVALFALFAVVFVNLNKFTEFLYYQF
jgi:alginate O-acetyltransferase complex protein AlgI